MFKPIRSKRIHEIIIDQVKDAVFSGRLRPGDRLFSERELVEQFSVSRTTVREALRTLENQGILVIKQGSEGGAFVAEAGHGILTESLSNMLRLGKVNVADLTDARLIIEPEAARLAAKRATKKDIEKLDKILEQAKKSKKTLRKTRLINLEFHRQMAHISRNPVVIFMIESVIDVMVENIHRTALDATAIKRVIDSHQEIIQAIKNQNYDRTFHIMRSHILEIQKALERSEGRLKGGEV